MDRRGPRARAGAGVLGRAATPGGGGLGDRHASADTPPSVDPGRRDPRRRAGGVPRGLRGAPARPCESMAYPFGDADARVVAATAAAGYRAATGPRRRCGPRAELAWPRMGIWHDDDLRRFRKKITRRAASMALPRLDAHLPSRADPAAERGCRPRRHADPTRGGDLDPGVLGRSRRASSPLLGTRRR